jgi:pyruvate dehydrogenase E1 component
MAQDGLQYFEPAFADELSVIMRFGFDYMQREGSGELIPGTYLQDGKGGSVYLRLSTRPLEQLGRTLTPELEADILAGAYWHCRPGPNCEVIIAYTGTLAPEAIEAVGLMSEDRRDVGLLAITSADRLHLSWSNAQRAREKGFSNARSHIERLLSALPKYAAIVTVVDGYPTTLSWLGSVCGHRTRALGVDHFGQTGTISDLYRHYGINAQGIMAAVEAMTPGRRIRYIMAA